ncbi:MAG: LCP family protein [Alicyclobacillus sp.]|nr:LCP family protein [Alicyclobacillus sp.]
MENRNTRRPAPNGRSPRDTKKRRRKAIIWSSIGAAALIAAGVVYADMTRPGDTTWTTWRLHHHIAPPPDASSRFTILLIGTDTRPGETGGNTDVLMVLSIDYKHRRIALLSVPRDTMVQLPHGITGKINAAYDIGGVQATDEIVQNLIHFDIPNYAITHFGGLVNIIDTIGGIWVKVPEPMHYNTGDKLYGVIDLNPGYQRLTGQQALGFVRFREDPLGDIGRTERQQAFLKALESALLKPSNILKLPQLVSEFSSTIDTNLSKSQELSFASNASMFKSFKMITMTLPGAYYDQNGISYWLVNPKEAAWMANRLFYQGIAVPKDQTIQTVDAVNNWTPPATTTGNGTGNAASNNTTSGNPTD